jgi:hypothetical protein
LAKYLVLSFEDDEDADAVVAEILSHAPNQLGISVEPGQFYACTVLAVYKKPTKFCKCTSIKKRGWTRGKKYGWWVCDQCKKPSEKATRPEAVTTYRNLLSTPSSSEADRAS